jgi:hypothetical protein
MKRNIILSIALTVCTVSGIFSQEVAGKLDEAKSNYKSGNHEDARFALQEALVEIDEVIGKMILDELPKKMGGLEMNANGDQVTGMSSSYVGLFVQRSYGANDTVQSADIEIISDSPLITGINAILSMPAFIAGGDPNQKRIKVDGYKSLLQKNVDENGVAASYDVQIPFGSSLLSFHCRGFANENDVIAMVNTIPVAKIVKIAR